MPPSSRPIMSMLLAASVLVTPLLSASAQPRKPAAGHPLTVYRCTDAQGRVTLQNGVPCPRGQVQQARTITPPTPAAEPPASPSPAPVAAPTAVAAPPPAPLPPTRTEPLPPPPLYRCRAWGGNNSYLSEDGTPAARCEALTVSGIDGGDNRAGAEACEMRQDHCERIPDEALCAAWQQLDRQTESLVKLENPDIAAKALALYRRTQRVVNTTQCATTAP